LPSELFLAEPFCDIIQTETDKNKHGGHKMNMVSVSEEGQIVIPAPLRKKFHIKKGSKLRIEEAEGGTIILRPLTDVPLEDPIEKSKGILKGETSLLNSLLEERKKEASRGK
jgi:AbrB family looped-hinge helix DNA binding protein